MRTVPAPVALPSERGVWRWVRAAGASAAVALGFAVVRSGFGASIGVVQTGYTIASVLAALALYQGLLRWNRVRTAASDPTDWMNGIGSMLAAAAVGNLVVTSSGLPLADQPWWRLQGELLMLAGLTIVLGTSITVAFVGSLARDPRVWLITAALATALGLNAYSLADTGTTVSLPAQVGLAVALVLLTVAARRRPSANIRATPATPTSTMIGALVVLGASVAVIAWNSLRSGHADVVPTLYGIVAVLASSARTATIVHELSQLAVTRLEARTDELTGVANRRALTARLEAAVGDGGGLVLLIWDLDRFKEVNDRHGHTVGDQLLRDVSRRVEELLPPGSLIARLGGDEFAVVMDGPDIPTALAVADAVVATVRSVTTIDDCPIQVGASVGVAVAEPSDDPATGVAGAAELLRRADVSMYRAKEFASGVCLYDEAIDTNARERRRRLDELRRLLEGDDPAERSRQLVVHYQPQLDIRHDRVVGVEALVRWRHPRLGLLAPDGFLDLVEEHGLMRPLTEHVLRTAAEAAVRWRDRQWSLRLGVNLSASGLSDPTFVSLLDDVLEDTGLDPRTLKLEITETTLMEDPGMSLRTTREIAARGIGVSIDDYGTGYSSLAYLNDLPATELKIDRAFTRRITSDERTVAIVAATIDLAHRLGQRVVAEGVEDEATLAVLRRLDCDKLQGYLCCRPLPLAEFERWLGQHVAVPPASVAVAG